MRRSAGLEEAPSSELCTKVSGLEIVEKFLQYTNSNPYYVFLLKETEKICNIIFSMNETKSIKYEEKLILK